ncbi:MAG: CehA/McbA family metallohydrolase [Thermoanaerobaculia bacterium]
MKTALGSLCLVATLQISAWPLAAETTARALEDGDSLVSDGIHSLVIGRSSRRYHDLYDYPTADAMGSIVSFWPGEGTERSSIMAGSPIVKFAGRLNYLAYSCVEVELSGAGETRVIRAEASFDGGSPEVQGQIETTYSMRAGSGVVEITSTLTNNGEESLQGIAYSLHYDGDQVYPYETELYAQLQFQLTPKTGHYLAWVDRNRLLEGEPVAVDLAPRESHEIQYALVTDRDSESLLRRVFTILGMGAEPISIRFESLGSGPFEVIVRDVARDFVIFRNFLQDPSPLRLMLPPARYSVTGNLFPAVVRTEVAVVSGKSAESTLVNPPRGRVRVAMKDDSGAPLPGKVTFIGLGGTPSPYFRPHDPVRSGRSWEEVKNSVYPALSVLDVELPVGDYLVSSSRGPEYSTQQAEIEVASGGLQELDFELERVVETEGLVAVDLHMHTLRSDGTVDERERVLSLVGEGVEVAVASDHFFRNDYTPQIEALGLENYLKVIPGSEISIRNSRDYEYTLDFNLYPLGPDEGGWEAFATLAEEVAPIFEATRKRYPGALIQLNHPRNSSWDYFVSYQLDPESAATARAGFWTGFDVLEVLNGPSPLFNNNVATIRDWLNLLSRGFLIPAVASSDSHQIDTEEPGYSRTYVYVADQEIEELEIGTVIKALKDGRSFVTNGPIVELMADDRYRPGDLFSSPRGEVELAIEVRTAPWVVVDEARVLVNGSVERVLKIEGDAGSRQALQDRVKLKLKRDAFVLVEVVGSKSLYPVLQAMTLSSDRPSSEVTPYALTNPVFVDVDGNGRFDAPLPREIGSRLDAAE